MGNNEFIITYYWPEQLWDDLALDCSTSDSIKLSIRWFHRKTHREDILPKFAIGSDSNDVFMYATVMSHGRTHSPSRRDDHVASNSNWGQVSGRNLNANGTRTKAPDWDASDSGSDPAEGGHWQCRQCTIGKEWPWPLHQQTDPYLFLLIPGSESQLFLLICDYFKHA